MRSRVLRRKKLHRVRRATTRCSPCVTIALLLCVFRSLLCGSHVLRCNVQQRQAALLVSDAGAAAGAGAGVGAGGVPSASAPACELPVSFLEDIFGPNAVVHSARFKDVWSQKCNEHGLNPAQLRVFFKDVGACSYLPRHIVACLPCLCEYISCCHQT